VNCDQELSQKETVVKARFSLADIDCVKRELASLLPNVKSSHRAEAMARGFGWKTNAALRAALAQESAERAIDNRVFHRYLEEHGFADTIPGALGEAVVRSKFGEERAAVQAVMDREANLSRNGFGFIHEPPKSFGEQRREFEEYRAQLIVPEGIYEFLLAREYLSYFPRRRTINEKAFSYSLKHGAERFHRQRGNDDNYVSNGALIAAAIHLGFNLRQNGLNAYFNMGTRQDRPVAPPAAVTSKHVARPRRARASYTNRRVVAWRNMLLAAINAGLDQNRFGLAPQDNRWQGAYCIYRFTLADMPAIAYVRDFGFDELSFSVAVKPTANADEWIGVGNAGFLAGEAFAWGLLERRNGKWLQTETEPSCKFRRALLPAIAQAKIQPKGYLPQRPVTM
jgi:hypothetical protein